MTRPGRPRPRHAAPSPGTDLRRRDTTVRELMDDPGCDPDGLRRTYARFGPVNRLVAGWRRIYLDRLRPLLTEGRATRLLDVGSGAGDVARALAGWATADGLRLEVIGIDPDPRAQAYAVAQPPTSGVTFRRASSRELATAGERFDVVISNHVLHHLDDAGRDALLDDSARLATRRVLHNDIARHRAAYVGYAVASTPLARGSFLRVDGLRSIRRSYRPDELAALVPAPWRVERRAPFRLLLTLDLPRTTASERCLSSVEQA